MNAKSRVTVTFPGNEPTLDHLEQAVMRLRDTHGAPRHANIIPVMGDRGTQRDPEPFVRGLIAEWTTED